jgi:hypothetical protein
LPGENVNNFNLSLFGEFRKEVIPQPLKDLSSFYTKSDSQVRGKNDIHISPLPIIDCNVQKKGRTIFSPAFAL